MEPTAPPKTAQQARPLQAGPGEGRPLVGVPARRLARSSSGAISPLRHDQRARARTSTSTTFPVIGAITALQDHRGRRRSSLGVLRPPPRPQPPGDGGPAHRHRAGAASKVSWPSRLEVKNATLVVALVTFVMALHPLLGGRAAAAPLPLHLLGGPRGEALVRRPGPERARGHRPEGARRASSSSSAKESVDPARARARSKSSPS